MTSHKVVSRDEWTEARKKLLVEEKAAGCVGVLFCLALSAARGFMKLR